jgi:hypothetical protein
MGVTTETDAVRTDECPSCGGQALVTYDQQRDGDGRVRVLFPRAIRCGSPGCEHYDAMVSIVDNQTPRRAAGRKSRKRRLTRRQRRAFERRDGEDGNDFALRTHRTLRARDLPELLLIRNDDRKQVEAMQLLVQVKVLKWTRALTFSTLLFSASIIVAAVVTRS